MPVVRQHSTCFLPSFISLLSQPGVDVNRKDLYGLTLLHGACGKSNVPLEVFKLLIEEYGADINAQTNRKYTPINLALSSSRSNQVKMYLLAIDFDYKDDQSRSIFSHAMKFIKEADNAAFPLIECFINQYINYLL